MPSARSSTTWRRPLGIEDRSRRRSPRGLSQDYAAHVGGRVDGGRCHVVRCADGCLRRAGSRTEQGIAGLRLPAPMRAEHVRRVRSRLAKSVKLRDCCSVNAGRPSRKAAVMRMMARARNPCCAGSARPKPLAPPCAKLRVRCEDRGGSVCEGLFMYSIRKYNDSSFPRASPCLVQLK